MLRRIGVFGNRTMFDFFGAGVRGATCVEGTERVFGAFLGADMSCVARFCRCEVDCAFASGFDADIA